MTRFPIAAAFALAISSLPANAQDCPPYSGHVIEAVAPDFAPVAPFPDTLVPEDRAASLDAAVERARSATAAPAIGAAVLTREGRWQSSDAGQAFYWASAGKLATSAIIMQLVEEGALTLQTPIANIVSGVPDGEAITIAMLLAHTSGLRSANEIVREDGLADPRSLAAELALVSDDGLLFCPGSAWRYSNTGYSLLGAVIEALDGGDYASSVERRLAAPLGLASFRALDDASDMGFAALSPAQGEPRFHPSRAGSAGSIVATPADMAQFIAALVSGQIVPIERLREMGARAVPMFDEGTYYGLGIMAYRFPGADGTSEGWLGHSGGVPGAKAVAMYDMRRGHVVAVALTGNGSAEATANLLTRAASGE